MDITVTKEVAGKRYNKFGDEIVPWRICGEGTTMKGTKLCDRCWELEWRISRDREIAKKILASLEA